MEFVSSSVNAKIIMTDFERLMIAVVALRLIAEPYKCESFTTGIGSCFKAGRTAYAEYTAERSCDSCIAHAALCLSDPTLPHDSAVDDRAAQRIRHLVRPLGLLTRCEGEPHKNA